jgi:calcium-dependent protein kinase
MAEKKIDRFIYKESERIGSGSFGEVFRGRDETTGEIVAIKIVKKKLIMQDKYLEEGLKSEMSIMKKLKSPNIVRYVDIAETHNNFYIFQEYCDSGDLAGFLYAYL